MVEISCTFLNLGHKQAKSVPFCPLSVWRKKRRGEEGREKSMELRRPVFGRTTLKIIAILTMLCDHIAYIFVDAWENEGLYVGMRILGRVSFPIFCFVLVQGFLSTRDVKKYLARLFIFAFLSEIPFDLAFLRIPFSYDMQNVLFTMLIGLLVLIKMQDYEQEGNLIKKGLVLLVGCAAAIVLNTDYSYFGVILICVFYLMRQNKKLQMFWAMLLIFIYGGREVYAVFALPFCYWYDPQRKEVRLPRYFFYAFYPLHLLILWGIWRIGIVNGI